jgi:hypothetical protein
LNKNIVFFKTFSHKNMFKRFKLLLWSSNTLNITSTLYQSFNSTILAFWFKSDGSMQRCSIYGNIRIYFRNTPNISSKGLTELQHIVYNTTDIVLTQVIYSKNKNYLLVSEDSYKKFLYYLRIFC